MRASAASGVGPTGAFSHVPENNPFAVPDTDVEHSNPFLAMAAEQQSTPDYGANPFTDPAPVQQGMSSMFSAAASNDGGFGGFGGFGY